MPPPGDREAGGAQGGRDGRLVKLREQGEDRLPIAVFVAAELPCLAFDKREESDCVLRIEPAQGLALARGIGATTNCKPLSWSATDVSKAARKPSNAVSRVSPSHVLWPRSSTVANARRPVVSRTSQW